MTIRDNRLPKCAVRQRSMIKRYRMLTHGGISRPNQNYKSAHILVSLAIVKIVIGLTSCLKQKWCFHAKESFGMAIAIMWRHVNYYPTCIIQGSLFWMCLQISMFWSSINVQNHMDDNSLKLQKCHLMWSIGGCCKLNVVSCFKH